jgi:hypothetical protein
MACNVDLLFIAGFLLSRIAAARLDAVGFE